MTWRHAVRGMLLGFGVVAGLVSTVDRVHGQASGDALRLPRFFGDGMVVQRGVPIPVWGWAAPGAVVTVGMRGATARATADGQGRWRVTLPALAAGGPYEVDVASGGSRVALHDVLVGDVWVASGQSNMEFPVSWGLNAQQEIAAANDPRLRSFTVPESWSATPQADVTGGSWEPADAQHVGHFSAAAYFFARELRARLKVPIGIIHTSWGGSNIETWTSRGALGLTDGDWTAVMDRERARSDSIRQAIAAKLGSLPTVDSGLVADRAVWADPSLDESGWATLTVPGVWERQGYAGMDGVAWLRTSFDLTPEEAARGATLSLGTIDDNDATWVNGVQVGRTSGYSVARSYAVPASALHAGRNVLAVRVEDGGGDGGIYGAPSGVFVDAGGARRPLAGTWRFRVGMVTFGQDGQRINKIPTVLYNQMLHPLLGLPIKGVIWYQGESNANNDQQAAAYRAQFAALIASWRREWTGTRGVFPFLWAQLPNYGTPDSVPARTAGWAILRESQSAALALPATGQAVTIDVGEAQNLHPRDKQSVGHRLALAARAVAYGEPVEHLGPTYVRHAVRGDSVVVQFAHAPGGIVNRAGNSGAVGGFAVAGADRRWAWAHARVDGSRVIVWADGVKSPVAVRYAYSNSPTGLVLYNSAGLPMAPFRTDTW